MNQQQDPRALIRLPAVIALTSLGKSSIYAMQKEGRFPPARRLTRRCVAWLESDVQAWIASRSPCATQ